MRARLRANGVAVARDAVIELCSALDLPTLPEARPGADLLVRARRGLPFPEQGTLLRAADGWVHPGPPTAWELFTTMAVSLGAPAPPPGELLPDVSGLPAEKIDAEAGEWRLPAVAVRRGPAAPDPAARLLLGPGAGHTGSHIGGHGDARGAVVVVLGTAWATPLAGLALARLGARVVRIENPRREDPFPLRDALASGQTRVALDFDEPSGLDAFVAHLAATDLLVDGNTPRVLTNLGLDDFSLRSVSARLSVVRVSAFAGDDRPGYGLAAECRAGWASRFGVPRLSRTSVADPVAGLLATRAGLDALARPGTRARVSLEGAVGHLLDIEARRG